MTRFHHAWSFRRIAEKRAKLNRDYLPGNAKPIPEPAAHLLLAFLGETFPEVVNFIQSLAVDDEGDRRAEPEHRAAVQRREILSFQFK